MNRSELVRFSQGSIEKGSKTFAFASRFFDRATMEDAAMLYHWCRFVDDAIDSASADERPASLKNLRSLTRAALDGGELPSTESAFWALREVVSRHRIPKHYPLELIEGMAMDADFQPLQDRAELNLYCYRVAGVVGLMMAHVMGVSDERALKHACDLGMAMQLTNIARDVGSDHALARCYLPVDLLARHGLDLSNYWYDFHRDRLARAVSELLGWADQEYFSGEEGVRYLRPSTALVILIARFSYAQIGVKVKALGRKAWDARVFTGRLEKLRALFQALRVWVSTFYRLGFSPWRATEIAHVWRLQ